MANIDFIQVDAFTDQPFRGNPAAVVVLADPVDEMWMQSVACEMNLSETAFCHPSNNHSGTGTAEWNLRWFTPVSEVDLCGHATLATAHVLTSEHGVIGEIGFHTRSGRLSAVSGHDGIRLDLPVDQIEACDVTQVMDTAVGTEVVAAGRGATDLLLEVATAAEVRQCSPNIGIIGELAPRGVIMTSACDDQEHVDVVSRFFAPNGGIVEDPVTGSAHTTLAAWWAPRLGLTFRAEQASARGGEMDVELVGDRVHLTGRAVTVARGMLLA